MLSRLFPLSPNTTLAAVLVPSGSTVFTQNSCIPNRRRLWRTNLCLYLNATGCQALGCQLLQENTVGDSVEGFVEDNVSRLSVICQVGHLIIACCLSWFVYFYIYHTAHNLSPNLQGWKTTPSIFQNKCTTSNTYGQ